MKDYTVFTSESVTEGHPDKVCDQVSDEILTEALRQDKNSRVACECFAGKNFLLIGGEMTTSAKLDLDNIARETIKRIGYADPKYGFNASTVAISVMMNTQSPDIALGVDTGGAGDQGIMFGYACNETPELMPAPIQYAHKLASQLSFTRKYKYFDELGPDGKTQISILYDNAGNVIGFDTILVSVQHFIGLSEVERIIKEEVIPSALPADLILDDTKILINPTGKFEIGGPMGDTGLTGRKIIVDTYGGYSRHGGGCFSGKDPTKVDRSAAYMARHIAKNIVANEMADRCEVQLAYAIGVEEPVSIYIDTFGTIAKGLTNRGIIEVIKDKFPLTPKGIIEYLKLLEVDYGRLAAYGHMGREGLGVSWENIVSL